MSCRMDSYETGCRKDLLIQLVVLDTNSAKRRTLFRKAKIHVIILKTFTFILFSHCHYNVFIEILMIAALFAFKLTVLYL